MTSKLKSETARINGARSRGPTTPAGLEKSSQNALKHGFTSASIIVLACELQSEFDEIEQEFLTTYKPVNPAEKDLVQEMVTARWRIHRLWGIETSLLDDEFVNQESKANTTNHHTYLARAFRALADESRSLALAHRYESRLHRIYDHAYETLRELQQKRPPLPPPPDPPANPTEPRASASDPPPEPDPPTETLSTKGTQAPTNPLESNKISPSVTPAPNTQPPPPNTCSKIYPIPRG